jgi:hypothetical protein
LNTVSDELARSNRWKLTIDFGFIATHSIQLLARQKLGNAAGLSY